MRNLLQYVTPPVILGVTAVLAAGAVGYALFASTQHPAVTFVQPTEGPIVEEVDVPGTVKAAQALDLSFQVGGRIVNAGPAVGTHVSRGETLAALSSADQAAQLEQAKANLALQQAKLQSLEAGATAQTVSVAQTGVTNAAQGLSSAQAGVIQAAQNAYVEADDAIHNRVDLFFTNSRSANPTLNLQLSNSQAQISIVSGRMQMEQLLTDWQAYENSLSATDTNSADMSDVVSKTRSYIGKVSEYLNLVASGLTNAIPTTEVPLATIQGYQTSIATARSNVSGSLSALNAANTALTSAQSALSSAQANLTLTKEPATGSELDAQKAAIASAQAAVDLARAQMAKTVITAPIAGVITINNANVGETASPNAPIISMISDSALQFETYVSETDLAKLKVGDAANVSLDAYASEEPAVAHVVAIDPAATIQNGISSYKVTLQFDDADPRLSAGETGTAKITTDQISNTMSVPTSAIITEGNDHFVVRKGGAGNEQVPVEIGVSSANGMTQILSGLEASDEIRTFGKQ